MDPGLMILGALAYLAVALWLIVLVAKRSRPGSARIRIVTTVFAIMFSVSLLVDHGVVPIPALAIIVWCVIGDCTAMYGRWGAVIWGFLPMLGQWVLLLIAALTLHKLRGRAKRGSGGDGPAWPPES